MQRFLYIHVIYWNIVTTFNFSKNNVISKAKVGNAVKPSKPWNHTNACNCFYVIWWVLVLSLWTCKTKANRLDNCILYYLILLIINSTITWTSLFVTNIYWINLFLLIKDKYKLGNTYYNKLNKILLTKFCFQGTKSFDLI